MSRRQQTTNDRGLPSQGNPYEGQGQLTQGQGHGDGADEIEEDMRPDISRSFNEDKIMLLQGKGSYM